MRLRPSIAAAPRLKSGKTPIARKSPRPATGQHFKSYHAQHAKPIRDPKTGKYFCVKPGKVSGSSPARRYPHKPMIARTAAPTPTAPTMRSSSGSGAHSSRSALYLFHKANGTLREYYRMFGLD